MTKIRKTFEDGKLVAEEVLPERIKPTQQQRRDSVAAEIASSPVLEALVEIAGYDEVMRLATKEKTSKKDNK